MRINTNLTALNTFNSYTAANNKIADSVAKLSSGYAINSAADNAAGLAISEKMRAQIRGLDKAASNSQDAISLVQTAEGALKSADEILQRMREIAVQSSSDTNEDSIDRSALQAEFTQLQSELDEISEDTTFNNQKLLDGSLSTTQKSIGSGTALNGSGMTASVGNADAGTYGFSVEVVTTQPAVAAAQPGSANFADSTLSSEFSAADVTFGASRDASALLNGNYELSATYDETSETLTVTATGDNGQTFTSDLAASDLGGIAAGGSISMNFETSSGAADTFTVALTAGETLTSATATTSELSSLADAIGGSFTVSGGKNAVEEQKAVMANLTGASSVELKAGMDSVAFDNGVTVSFEELTASDLDTTATGGLSVALAAASALSSVEISTDFSLANDTIATEQNGAYTVSAAVNGNDVDVTFDGPTTDYTATIANGNTTAYSVGDTITADFTNSNDGSTFSLTVTLGQDVAAGALHTALTGAFTGAISGIESDASDATADPVINMSYNFENVFGDTTISGGTDSGVSSSTIEVTSKSNDGLTIQVGANSGDELSINIDCASAEHLGVKGLNVGSQESAAAAIDSVNNAINNVSSQRAYLGAVQNRLDYKISNLETSSQNLTSAESAIRDVDMAAEMTKFTNANILSQAATAMLAQANSLPQNVLSLLG